MYVLKENKMAKRKEKELNESKKKKVPYNTFRKGVVASILGLTLGFSAFGLAGCSDGVDGKDGKDGTSGTIWKSGTSYTEFTDAKVGDYFIDTDDYILYQKGTNDWTIVMENYGKPGENGNDAVAPTITINSDGYWCVDGKSTGIKAKGDDGTPGATPKVEIKDGYWYINDVKSVKAESIDGHTPVITINAEGYWVIDNVSTQTKATPSTITIVGGYWYIDDKSTGVKAEGKDGTIWLTGTAITGNGTGISATIANSKVGDLYFNTDTCNIYQCIAENTWKWIANIKGNAGQNGANSTIKQYGKYTCLGDSISYGAGSTTGNVSWCDYLAEQLGATLTKYAVSGQKIWEHLRSQVEKVGADAELVTLMMGVNDCSEISASTKTLGVVDDVIMMENDNPENYEDSTLYNDSVLGRFRWCLERLKVKAPNARIVVITPLPYNDNATLKQLIQAQASICNAIGIEVLIPTDSIAFSTDYFQTLQSDTLHPNDAGYKVVAGYVYQNLGDVKYYEAAEEYQITTNITNISASVGNVSYIKTGGVVTLTFTANTGYSLPDTISVTGASYTWNKNSGTIVLQNPTDDVTIGINAVEQDTEKFNVTYNINNHGEQPEQVNDVNTLPATLPFLEATGYTFGGWYLDTNFTNKAVSGAKITANTTLYAKWIVEQLSNWASSGGTFGNANYFSQTNNWNEDVHVTKFCYFNGGEETITAQLFIYDTATNTITKAYKFENIIPGKNEIDVDFTMSASENWIVQVSKNSYWISTPSGGSGIVICNLSSCEVGGIVTPTTAFAQYTLPANLVGTLLNS